MDRKQLVEQIKRKRSFLCVGLDTEQAKLPAHICQERDPITAFNKAIIEATAPYAVAYKFNIAFYESLGPKGWESLERSLAAVPKDCFTIADAKRGDIGNTSTQYAKTFFERYHFDSVTVAPYMGRDSVQPFLDFNGKWTIVLGHTSNAGSADFQHLDLGGELLSERVMRKVQDWGTKENLMFVVGAVEGELMRRMRAVVPDHFLLVPGVGAQGGSLEEVVRCMMTNECGLLVNSSRGIIYASSDEDFAKVAGQRSEELQAQMAEHLRTKGMV